MTEEPSGENLLIRRQIDLVLDSPGFAGSPRLREFFRYVCQAALDGRTEVDQIEIAETVLGRADDFNPVEDTSVRKLATLARHKLAQYYSGKGQGDPVVVFLPQRSYLPRFRLVDPSKTGASAPMEESESFNGRTWIFWTGIAAALVLLAVLVIYGWRRAGRSSSGSGRFTIITQKGNLNLGRQDVPPECLLLGPVVGSTDQVIARMVYSPRFDSDQAGIMVFQDADNYVKFGRSLSRHNNLWFTAERRGILGTDPETHTEDPDGQTGEPIWLAIRRNGDEFKAFVSSDGFRWRRVGQVVHALLQAGKARMAIYGFRDVEDKSPLTATFDHLSIGPPLATWGEDTPPPSALDGWEEIQECKDQTTITSNQNALELSFAEAVGRCRWNLLRPVPEGDWSVRILIDSSAWARTFAGIAVRGRQQQRLYVLRNSMGGGSIVGPGRQGETFHRPDFPGSPPLVFHLYSRNSFLHAEVSTNWETFEPLPLNFDLRTLGDNLRAGPTGGRGMYQANVALAPIGFRFVGFDVLTLDKYR